MKNKDVPRVGRRRFLTALAGTTSGLVLTACFPSAEAGAQEKFPKMTMKAKRGDRIEVLFEIAGLTGSPFDPAVNDVRVTFQTPDGKTTSRFAFFDGGNSWRARLRATASGQYSFTGVTNNSKAIAVTNPAITTTVVSSPDVARHGVIRFKDSGGARPKFAFEDGTSYYPLGHNTAWKSGDTPDIPELLTKMGSIGENWARIWMNHWDDKNLDWQKEFGIRLEIAKRWDDIVATAEKSGVYFQMTIQHHGPYSSNVNSNWGENPWNKALGGFLATPADFFTDAEAKRRTLAKFRYIVARYADSPAILAWELWNEVEWVDAVKSNPASVTAWHNEMAKYLRDNDPEKHLICSSSTEQVPGMYDNLDYRQPHSYPSDAVSTVWKPYSQKEKQPRFFGEIGPGGTSTLDGDDGSFLHDALWASLMSDSVGAAQYWTWDHVHRANLYSHFASAAAFVKASKLAEWPESTPARLVMQSKSLGKLTVGPGGGWANAERKEYPVSDMGYIEGIESMPRFVQGAGHRDMFEYAEFPVTFAKDGTFSFHIVQSAKMGANAVVKVDGKVVAEKAFPAGDRDANLNITLDAPVPAGKHVVRLENTGADWFVLNRMTIAPFGSSRRAIGKVAGKNAALWVYGGAGTEGDTITLPDLPGGTYRIVWWDTKAGKPLSETKATVTTGKPLAIPVPASAGDVAAFVVG